MSDPLPEVLAALRASTKYAHVSEDIVRRVATEELAKRRNTKEAIKAAKNKLHQIGGAYQGDMRYAKWLSTLTADPSLFPSHLTLMLAQHASTRERLPLLDTFYRRIFDSIDTSITSVLDVACGLNPLTLPWMPLPKGVQYLACDIYGDMMEFLNECFAQLGYVNAHAQVCDVVSEVSLQPSTLGVPVDVAFVLKTIPCLEQVDKTIGSLLLDALNAKHIVVSFPAQSLGGRNKNMAAHYAAHFDDLMANCSWAHRVQRLDFATELVFVVTRRRS